tara:strand:- start:13845 stop:16625 length:2781 start_codon:yes stop_codon:yes gene_type:complete
MVSEYIVLDLETTGLDPANDMIIEIGAVKIQDNQVVDEFSSFVNPGVSIPDNISKLTGIYDSDVANAASLDEVRHTLEAFVGTFPIVGQFISFDMGFLYENDIRFANQTIDTRDLAIILLPTLSSYSLASLVSYFEIDNVSPHKALSDAKATADVFINLKNMISKLDFKSQLMISLLAERSNSDLSVFFNQEINLKKLSASGNKFDQLKALKNSASNSEISEIDKIAFDISLSDVFDKLNDDKYPLLYEHRAGQIQLADEILNILQNGGRLLSEAGPGLGKSLAYLLAACHFSLNNGEKVIISTHRNNLQNQLFNKEYQLAKELVNDLSSFNDLRVSVLKGRQNYICLNKFSEILSKLDELDSDAFRFYSRIAVWIENTEHGDYSEINLNKKERFLWSALNANDADCLQNSKRHNIFGQCFLYKARSAAEASNIIIINHSLLIANSINNENVLPYFDNLILDEAHQLHNVAAAQLAESINLVDIQRHISRNIIPAMMDFRKNIFDASLAGSDPKTLEISVKDAQAQCEDAIAFLRSQIKSLQENFDRLTRNLQYYNSTEQEVPIVNNLISHTQWLDSIDIAKKVASYLNKTSNKISTHLNTLEVSNFKDSTYKNKLKTFGLLLDSKSSLIEDSMLPNKKNYLICFSSSVHNVGFTIRPNDISESIENLVYNEKNAIVALSATLKAYKGDTYDYKFIAEEIGLQDAKTLSIQSPYDYKSSVLALAIKNIAEPSNRDYVNDLAESIYSIASMLKGQCLVLFTSNDTLEKTYHKLVEAGNNEVVFFAQGIDGQPFQLLRKFQDNPNSVLMGTASFWDGVDIPNNYLKCVIMTRLPFSVPSDPIVLASTMNMATPFPDYQLPSAILKFRQGFGRLIRGSKDRGIFVLLDSRLSSKNYGHAFETSLDDVDLLKIDKQELSMLIERWSSNDD